MQIEPALAQEPAAEQQRLYEQMVRQPTNYDVTFAFVKVATERGDYEAAIGALERLLYYNSDLPLVKYELGTLYYRLGAYEMARRYFGEALASPDIDAVTKARIETYLPDADKQLQQSRLSGFLQTGLRYQSNASFVPDSGIVRFEGQNFGLTPTNGGKSDTNWFGLAGLNHDYDLQDQRGDILETRFVGYLGEQFRLQDFNVGLFNISLGPRLALAPDLLPGVTIKPYVVGGNTWLAGTEYLASAGAGLSLDAPLGPRVTITPVFEWEHVTFHMTDPLLSGFNSGDWFTGGVSSAFSLTQQVELDARTYYRRGEASATFQTFDQWVVEAALSFQFAPPLASIPRSWTISPFARLVRTDFDAPNPFIDPRANRTDNEWVAGITFDMPIYRIFGLSTSVQYDRTDSTLPNFRQGNLSIISGPTVRF